MKFLLLIGLYCVLLNCVTAQLCTDLSAFSTTLTFDSHSFYGISDYSSYENSCWIIEAPYGKVVYLDSESFQLEDYCPDEDTGDRVNLYDGDSTFDSLDLTRCGSEGVNSYRSSGRYVYVEFRTDGSIEASGFRMSYRSEDDDDVDLSTAAIVGIVIGSLLALALLVGLIVCCVVVIVSTQKRGGKVNPTTNTGQTMTYTNHAHYQTQQQPTGYIVGTAIVVSSQPSIAEQYKGPSQQPQQQLQLMHPVDASGIPMPAVYNVPQR